MKKLMNDVDTMLTESLDGFAAAHADIISLGAGRKFVQRRHGKSRKVALVSGGGSGHEPLHIGFVGHGMLDAACPGQVFTSPSPDQIIAASDAVDTGAGILYVVKNYEGDTMNFAMAREMGRHDSETVVTDDDVALNKSLRTTGRRGVAGTVVVTKILGAAAEMGMKLKDLKALGERVNEVTRSMGVALSSCTVPAAGKPTFELGPDEMEMGVGIHGEAGRQRLKLKSADEIASDLVCAIASDLGSKDEALLVVNGFGATPIMELYVMFNSARTQLSRHGIKVSRALVGNYVTSLDMAGCSITVTSLDKELAGHWDAAVHTSALRWGM
jgi:dihydroxyacetone kinase-like protein